MKVKLIFSKQVLLGRLEIWTPKSTFDISHLMHGQRYFFRADFDKGFVRIFDSPFEAIVAAATHSTSCNAWDASEEKISRCASKWTRHLSKKFRIDVMAAYIDAGSLCTYRELDEYFHIKHRYMLDRMEIIELLKELYTTGQLSAPLLSDFMPWEYGRVHRIAKGWCCKEADS